MHLKVEVFIWSCLKWRSIDELKLARKGNEMEWLD